MLAGVYSTPSLDTTAHSFSTIDCVFSVFSASRICPSSPFSVMYWPHDGIKLMYLEISPAVTP